MARTSSTTWARCCRCGTTWQTTRESSRRRLYQSPGQSKLHQSRKPVRNINFPLYHYSPILPLSICPLCNMSERSYTTMIPHTHNTHTHNIFPPHRGGGGGQVGNTALGQREREGGRGGGSSRHPPRTTQAQGKGWKRGGGGGGKSHTQNSHTTEQGGGEGGGPAHTHHTPTIHNPHTICRGGGGG